MSASLSSIGGVDASIPLQAGKGAGAPIDPIQQIDRFAKTANSLNQLKLFPGQQTLQQQEIQSGSLGLDQKTLQTAALHNQAAWGIMAPAIAHADDPSWWTHANVATLMGTGEANGVSMSAVANAMTKNPTGDGQALRDTILPQILAGTQPAASATSAVAPVGTNVDQGLGIQMGTTPALGMPGHGSFNPIGGQVPVYPTRGQLAQPVSGPVNPSTGAPTSVPLGARTPPELSGLNLGPGRPGGSAATVPAGLVGPNTPRTLPGQIDTGVGPGKEAQLTQTAGDSAKAFSGLAQEAQSAQDQSAVLSNMRNDLENFKAGPGAKTVNDLENVIQGWIPGVNDVYKTKIAAKESFDKLAHQLVTTAAPGSDARQAEIVGATPSSAQSPEGVDFILRQLQGVNDYKMARANLAAAPGVDRTDYPNWQKNVGGALDPRVFQFARLSPDQQRTYFNAIPQKERDAFKQKYIEARDKNFYGVNNGAQ